MSEINASEFLITNPTEGVGVDPKGTHSPLSPRQSRFMELYLDPGSGTFGNAFQSALGAGYSEATARNFMHLKPAWLSEIIGQISLIEPELLLLKLVEIMNDKNESTRNKLKSIDMLMKHRGMYKADSAANNVRISIDSILA